MMKITRNQRGVSIVEVIAALVLVGGIWWQYSSSATKKETEEKLAAAEGDARRITEQKAKEEKEAKEEKAKSLREKEELDRLPPQSFPVPEQASISRVTKFLGEYYGKYLVFDLAGVSVDDLKRAGENFYLNSVRDLGTNEYISHYDFKFVMSEAMAKSFYEALPGADAGLVHYRMFCVPQYDKGRNENKCRALKIQIFNVGGNVKKDFQLQVVDNFKMSKRSAQNEIIELLMGKYYHD